MDHQPGPADAAAPDDPLVSVFTPTHEIGAGIELAWRSLLAQTLTDWEWVIVDDSPSPGTFEHLAALAERPEAAGRVRAYRQVPPTGSVGANKAAATALCRGRILVELDHDDELLPDALEVVAATFLAHPDIVFADSDWLDWIDAPDGGYPGRFPDGWGFGLGAYASEIVRGRRVPVALAPPLTWRTIRHIVSTPNHLRAWRADAYRAIGGHDRRLPVADDYDLVVRTFLHGPMAHIPRPLYIQHHRPDQGNTSRRRNAEIQERVATIAATFAGALDHRCLALGVTPTDAAPWSAAPLVAANTRIDVGAERAADRGEPLVSVIVPTYRRPEPLRRAILSALAQTWPAVEVLVVGDACPDVDTVVATIDDPRLRHANLTTNHADSGATPRNHALMAMARGVLIAYLDDDNEWTPDHLASLAAPLAADPAIGWAFASFQMAGHDVICHRPRRFQVDTSAIVHRRTLTDRFGGWRTPAELGHVAHDWELTSRWGGERWFASRRVTVHYTVETSHVDEATLRHILAVAEEERPAAEADPAGRESPGEGVNPAETAAGDVSASPATAEATRDEGAPRVAVYGIALDEAANVARWAATARGADAVVLLDTGSTDGTADVARAAGIITGSAAISPFRFDAARDQALDLVPDDIDVCVALDLDEELAPGWREALTAAWRDDATRLRAWLEWPWDDAFPPLRFTTADRVHARHGYRWRYPVHEGLAPTGPDRERPSDVVIRHIRDPREPRSAYLPLLRLRAAEHPDDAVTAHLLSSEFRGRGEIAEAIAEERRALESGLPDNERLHALLMLAWMEPDNREALLLAACAAYPARREPWCTLAQLHADRGAWRACRQVSETALRITEPADDYLTNPFAWGAWPERLAAVASARLLDIDRAIAHATRALDLEPGDADALAVLTAAGVHPAAPG